jgi:cysteine desulfurase
MMQEIYLDNASTTKVLSEVAEAMISCMLYDYGNPSSTHSIGERAANRLKEARAEISSVLSANPSEIVFTSGGTEASNIAVLGAACLKKRKGMHCITTSIEHPSVLNAFKRLSEQSWEVSYLPVDSEGIIKIEHLERSLRKDTVLVSIMHINNEIGSIQPLKEVGRVLGKLPSRPLFHVDAVQSFCKYPVIPIEWGAHMISLSAHKIHSSKGVGALYIKKGIKLKSIFSGGEQESGIRAGTENIPGIVGMAEAVRILRQDFEDNKLRLLRLKSLFFNGLKKIIPSLCLIGPGIEDGACHILSMSVPGIPAQVMQRALSAKGVHVGIGAACSSMKKQVSHVLDAIGLEDEKKRSAIRISFSFANTEEQIKRAIAVFEECFNELTIK